MGELNKLRFRDRRAAEIRAEAERAFAKHTVQEWHRSECGKFASWRCGEGDLLLYHFNITIEPGRLIFSGDLGLMVWERGGNMLAWALSAIDSTGYFAEKVARAIETKEWSPEVAVEWVRDELEQDDSGYYDDSQRDAMQDMIGGGIDDMDRTLFGEALFEHSIVTDSDYPDCNRWTNGFLWACEGVRWFLANHKEATP